MMAAAGGAVGPGHRRRPPDDGDQRKLPSGGVTGKGQAPVLFKKSLNSINISFFAAFMEKIHSQHMLPERGQRVARGQPAAAAGLG